VVMQRVRGMFSSQRSYLNGLRVNRAKYTTFSRHFTFARVLRQIADCVQNELLPGDTFVDFACGQNSFGSLLKDPATNEPLPTIAFDILSPAERTDDFHRHPWHAVDASVLPPGELVIGLNPPFGHQNREAIEFVEHALCAKPRMIALIMPATNYAPRGYDLVKYDDQMCRGYAFYAPGSLASNNINANKQSPAFMLFRRRPETPTTRHIQCQHRLSLLRLTGKRKMEMNQGQNRARILSQKLETRLMSKLRGTGT